MRARTRNVAGGHRVSIGAVPAKLVCIFCEGVLLAETSPENGSLVIRCDGCDKEMIDCDCALDLQRH